MSDDTSTTDSRFSKTFKPVETKLLGKGAKTIYAKKPKV